MIEAYLRLSPEERAIQHQLALDALEQLQAAYIAAQKTPLNIHNILKAKEELRAALEGKNKTD